MCSNEEREKIIEKNIWIAKLWGNNLRIFIE